MALADALLDSIFAKLAATYGMRFVSRFSVTSPAAFRRDWATALHGMTEPQIAYALENLPVKFPPTVLEFRLSARSMPASARSEARQDERWEPTPIPPEIKAKFDAMRRKR